MLDWRREGNVVRYFCSSCGKELAEKYDLWRINIYVM